MLDCCYVTAQPTPEPTQEPTPNLVPVNTPMNLRTLYSVGGAEGFAAGNRQAVTAFLEQEFSPVGLDQYWHAFCTNITCGKGNVTLVGDGSSPVGIGGTEAMLDIESITGVAGNIESEFWGFAGRSPDNPTNEPFLKWLVTLSNTPDSEVPKIFSTSYGEDEGSWSYGAENMLNVEFMKAGARGISLLFASGDSGANCKGVNGSDSFHDGRFFPEGPGSSPYVTSVGGTQPADGYPRPGSETAIQLSSGGFSNYWPMPDWQKGAVEKYLRMDGLPPLSRGYNTSGRAYPDIAAQASDFTVYSGRPLATGTGGTSCAAPTASGIFSLLNDVRLAAGKSSLGFMNPLIYEYMGAFNDITTGYTWGCMIAPGQIFPLGQGWPAKLGWDAATGVGTPSFSKLKKVLDDLPAGHGPDVFV